MEARGGAGIEAPMSPLEPPPGYKENRLLDTSYPAESAEVPNPAEVPEPVRRPPKRIRNPFYLILGFRFRVMRFLDKRLGGELTRRVLITVLLLCLSRVGLFVPLPGFNRAIMPGAKPRGNRWEGEALLFASFFP